MKFKLTAAALITFAAIFFSGFCSTSVDTNSDFAMVLNGRGYKVKLNPAIARVRVSDVGYSESYHFSVMFPAKSMNRFKVRGFELTFEPRTVEMGKTMISRAGDKNYSLAVSYYPLVGHKVNEGIMLEYSSRYKTGDIKVRFDILEPRLGGRVKGTILSAVLFGYYQSQDAMEPMDPEDPKKLEIYNFPFDATFESSMF
jgi:hypothetical protein